MPILSVIMTTYNEKLPFLNTCVQSILNQTFKDLEFIICIEPEENNFAFLENISHTDRRVKILKNKVKLGIAASRNHAILESTGKYITLIDSDDFCDLHRLDKQLKFLEENSDISVVGSNMFLINVNDQIVGIRKYPESHKEIKNKFLITMAVANPTLMISKKDLLDIKLFNKKLNKAEDFELWLRFLSHNKKMHNLQENLVYYRVPFTHNEKRGNMHWKNNYNARKRYSKFIWPLHKRVLSISLFYFISRVPNNILDFLFKFKFTDVIRNIKTHNV